MRFLWDSLFARPSAKKHSLLNRMRDYQRLQKTPELFSLHKEINELLYESSSAWDSYDYGEGYFYQSFAPVGLSGLRNTEARVEAMGLNQLLHGKTVVDVGCNTGFLALSLADSAFKIIGCDINPFLVKIGNATASYLGTANVELVASTFEDFLSETVAKGQVDVVLSFANHSTFDGNTQYSLEEYFRKCQNLLKPDGLLVFESHHPDYEGKELERTLAVIKSEFQIIRQEILSYGSRIDRGRTFLVAKHNSAH